MLEKIKNNPKKKIQRAMLCTWIVELKLDKLNRFGAATEGEIPESASRPDQIQKQKAEELFKKTSEELKGFLIEYEQSLDTDTIFQILQNHGKLKDCLSFAKQKVCIYTQYIVEKL